MIFISFNFVQIFVTFINIELITNFTNVPDDPGVDGSVQDVCPLAGLLEP